MGVAKVEGRGIVVCLVDIICGNVSRGSAWKSYIVSNYTGGQVLRPLGQGQPRREALVASSPGVEQDKRRLPRVAAEGYSGQR